MPLSSTGNVTENRRSRLLRIITLTSSVLIFMYSLAISMGVWWLVNKMEGLDNISSLEGNIEAPGLSASQKGGIIPVGIMWTLVCVISILGIFGSSLNHLQLTSAYCTMLLSHYILDFIIGLWFLYVLYTNTWMATLKLCSKEVVQFHLNKTACTLSEKELKSIYVGTFFAGKVLGFGVCLIATLYRQDLQKQAVAHLPPDHPIHLSFNAKPEPFVPDRRSTIQFADTHYPGHHDQSPYYTSYGLVTSPLGPVFSHHRQDSHGSGESKCESENDIVGYTTPYPPEQKDERPMAGR